MPCYFPLVAWRGKVQDSGKRSIVFKVSQVPSECFPFKLKVPCGQCIGCRLERSRQWALRCVHEASLYEHNCFITLTFEEGRLPVGGSLSVRTFQAFMKRLRRWLNREQYDRSGKLLPLMYRPATRSVRFFHCGEYGENLGRPHYHALLFGLDFADKVLFKVQNGNRLYNSADLDSIWGRGFAVIGDVTYESAAYVARYVMKKVSGSAAPAHYKGLLPEYVTMSRRPGIGSKWFDKFKDDVYPHGYAVFRGQKLPPPKFYDSLYEVSDAEAFKALKAARVSRSKVFIPAYNDVLKKSQMIDDNCDARLIEKEICKRAQIGALVRPLEAV